MHIRKSYINSVIDCIFIVLPSRLSHTQLHSEKWTLSPLLLSLGGLVSHNETTAVEVTLYDEEYVREGTLALGSVSNKPKFNYLAAAIV